RQQTKSGVASYGDEGAFSFLPSGGLSHGGVVQVDLNYLKSLGDGPGTQAFQNLMEHELGHVLGFGDSNEWSNLVTKDPNQNNNMSSPGTKAGAEYGGRGRWDLKVAGHWAPSMGDANQAPNQIEFQYPGDPSGHAAMQKTNRVGFTRLDFAALQ